MNKRTQDRLAKFKTAGSYPTGKDSLAARRTAHIAQTIIRPLGDVPIAEVAPKHLSSAYTRQSIRRVKVSQWLESFREFIAEQLRELAIPERRAKMNPAYTAIPDNSKLSHRNIGPICTTVQGSTHSTLAHSAIQITPDLLRRSASILAAIPSDTIFPEARKEREYAQWILDTPRRIMNAKADSARLSIARNQGHQNAIAATAFNARQFAITSSAIQHIAITSNGADYIGVNALYRNRQKLSELVPMAAS